MNEAMTSQRLAVPAGNMLTPFTNSWVSSSFQTFPGSVVADAAAADAALWKMKSDRKVKSDTKEKGNTMASTTPRERLNHVDELWRKILPMITRL